jgi:hypothetical protein
MWELSWTKWHWDRFLPEYFGFLLSISFRRCSITWKNEKKLIIFHLHHRVGKEALRLRCVRSICCGALHPKKQTIISTNFQDVRISLKGSEYNRKRKFWTNFRKEISSRKFYDFLESIMKFWELTSSLCAVVGGMRHKPRYTHSDICPFLFYL